MNFDTIPLYRSKMMFEKNMCTCIYIYVCVYVCVCVCIPELWSGQKPWWNWYLTPVVNFGEVRRAQLASSPRWNHWDVFRSYKVSSEAKKRVGCRKQREATAPIQFLVKLQPWFLSLQWMTCLRQRFLGLQWRTCLWAEHWWWWYNYTFVILKHIRSH